jgi:hypothetical protein
MKTIAGTMAEMLFVVKPTQGSMNGALQITIDVSNAQTITTVLQRSHIAIGTWNVKSA